MVRTFEQIKKDVYALPLTCDERFRIEEELDLFEIRGWNDYIALAINLIVEIEEKVVFCFTGFSVLDSLFVLKATGKYVPDNFVNKKHARDILFNDALRLKIEVVYAYEKELVYYCRLANFIITEYLKMKPIFKSFAKTLKNTKDTSKRLFVIANSRVKVSKEDLNIIEKEKSDGPREEINVLNKYFMIYLTGHLGI